MTAPLLRATSTHVSIDVPAAPVVCCGFREASTYRFESLEFGADELSIDDEPLPRSRDGAWTWSPRFFAGRVRGVLRRLGRDVAQVLLDVNPDPQKLGSDIFDAMVDTLWAFDPAFALGTEPASRATGRRGRPVDDYVQFERMRRYGPSCVDALRRIRARPSVGLLHERELVPIERLKRADLASAQTALRDRNALACLRGRSSGPAHFDAPCTAETYDCAPNRALVARIRGLRVLIARLMRRGDRYMPDESETRTSLAARWPERRRILLELDGDLLQLVRATPFSDVTRPEVTAAGLTAIQSDPLYARAWRFANRACNTAVDGDPDERHALSPSWEIYERWCYLQVVNRIRATHPALQWRERTRFGTSKCERAMVGSGVGERVVVLFQPGFRSAPSAESRNRTPIGPWSISGRRVPDIVVLREIAGSLATWSIYDAKYRSGNRNLLDAMASAHIYRDSLRWDALGPTEVILLAPTVEGAGSLTRPEYRQRYGVGIERLIPE